MATLFSLVVFQQNVFSGLGLGVCVCVCVIKFELNFSKLQERIGCMKEEEKAADNCS